MTPGSVARRYARAVYELAQEDNSVAATGAALQEVAAAVGEVTPDALRPGLLSAEARSAIGNKLSAAIGQGSMFGKFLAVVADADRLDQLQGVSEWFQRIDDEAAGRVRARITAADELNPTDRASIRESIAAVTKREVVEEVEVDPGLVGGIRVEVEGRVFDGTVKTRLARLAARMSGEA